VIQITDPLTYHSRNLYRNVRYGFPCYYVYRYSECSFSDASVENTTLHVCVTMHQVPHTLVRAYERLFARINANHLQLCPAPGEFHTPIVPTISLILGESEIHLIITSRFYLQYLSKFSLNHTLLPISSHTPRITILTNLTRRYANHKSKIFPGKNSSEAC
jgi:hypothetical protein